MSIINIRQSTNNELTENILADISSYNDMSMSSGKECNNEDENKKSPIPFRSVASNIAISLSYNENTTNFISHPNNNIKSIKKIECFPPIYKRQSDDKIFSVIKCSRITTYFLGRIAFSQVNKMDIFKDDYNTNVLFITKSNIYGCFPRLKTLPGNLYQMEIPKETVDKFILSVNDCFYKEFEYKAIIASYTNKMILLWLLVIICLASLTGIMFYSYENAFYANSIDNIDYLVALILFLSFALFLVYSIYILAVKIKDLPFDKLSNVIQYRYRKVNQLLKFITDNNNLIFAKYSITISIPLSIDYIMLNCSPVEIQIHSHSLNEFI